MKLPCLALCQKPNGRPLTGGRGLKPSPSMTRRDKKRSPPHGGARIETTMQAGILN